MPKLKTLLSAIFSVRSDTQPRASTLAVGEEIASNWHYHLQQSGNRVQALCGARIMQTRIPLQAWGVKTHLDEHYCAECAALAARELPASVRAAA
jgi:hypothetical protein